jgi:hypothetical protein
MECEDVLGAGVTFPRGADASNVDCAFSSGGRFIDKTQADVSSAFECAARVGTGSTDDPERPMEAMVGAVASSGESATCNEGFLRDDAILVVTIITDENDDDGDGSAGTPDGWRQALLAAKGNNPNSIVVLSLTGGNGCEEDAPRIQQFVSTFGDKGIAGSICGDFNSFFQSTVATIDSTCDDFIPPG